MKHWAPIVGIIAVVILAVTSSQAKDVAQIPMTELGDALVDSIITKLFKLSPARLKTFKYNNCGDPTKETANITTLVIGPDPLVFPGTLIVQFAGYSKITVNSPINVALLLEIKAGSTWVKIPCISQIGSCTYDDICEILAQIPECPAPLVSAGIPCQCPFPQGSYNLPQTEFEVDIELFPPGDYHAVANITNNENFVSCVELFVTFG